MADKKAEPSSHSAPCETPTAPPEIAAIQSWLANAVQIARASEAIRSVWRALTAHAADLNGASLPDAKEMDSPEDRDSFTIRLTHSPGWRLLICTLGESEKLTIRARLAYDGFGELIVEDAGYAGEKTFHSIDELEEELRRLVRIAVCLVVIGKLQGLPPPGE